MSLNFAVTGERRVRLRAATARSWNVPLPALQKPAGQQLRRRGCGKPIVLSNNDGCVIARSNEAKALGIEMGAPWHLHRENLSVRCLRPLQQLHSMSSRVMQTLRHFTSRLAGYSINEAFLDLAGFGRFLNSMHALSENVLQWRLCSGRCLPNSAAGTY
jgi:nucleotidyltransferase/DNA polymerase involved in DNA repair